MQKTIVKAEIEIVGFQGTRKYELEAWLRTILSNVLKEEIRHHRAKKRDKNREVAQARDSKNELVKELAKDQSTPSKQLIEQESQAKLHAALDRLSEDYQQAIRLRSYERLSWKEIGERLGRSPDSARKLWARALIQLQHLMGPKDGSR